jgi:glyoxylase-like metal-dependent hydrolase (beta-lactamase superfamily II)
MKPKAFRVASMLAVAGALLPTAPLAQQAPAAPPGSSSDMVDRFARGRSVILAAVDAAGGQQALRGITGIAYTLEGDVFNDIQGYSAARIGNPVRDSAQRIVNRYDIKGARFAQVVEQTADSGYNSRFGTYWSGGVQVSARSVPAEYNRAENAPSPFAAAGPFMVSSRWLPPVILQRAAQNMRSAMWVGDGDVEGAAADIVEFSFDEQVRFRLYVTRSDRAIRRVETLAPDPVSADDTTIALLSGAQKVGGVVMPERIVAIRRGFANQTFVMKDVAINPAFADADFAAPAGYALVELPAGQPRAHHVSGRVHEVRGLAGGTYQVPFVVMDDFVVAYEAPLGLPATRQVIAEIKRVAGDKPIRYVVISHFHADHAGGIGAYAEIGATVLSAATNRAALETYAANNRPRLQGQEGPKPGVALKFEAVPSGGRTLTDAKGGRLDIVEFAGNSHVESMLALYDPESGTFMGADHHIRAITWNPTFQRTADWFRRQPKAQLLLGTHDAPMTRAEFLARAKARPALPPAPGK